MDQDNYRIIVDRVIDQYFQQPNYFKIDGLPVFSIFNFHKFVEDYIVWGEEAMKRKENWDEALDIPYFPNVSIGWDDTPRFPAKGKANVIHYTKSPESFAVYLQKARDYIEDHPDQSKLITLFSWNEWVEGGYLLPDMRWEYGYLEAIQKVMCRMND